MKSWRLIDIFLFALPVSLLVGSVKLITRPLPIYLPELISFFYLALILVKVGPRAIRPFWQSLDGRIRLAMLLIGIGTVVAILVAPSRLDALGAAKSWLLIPAIASFGYLLDRDRSQESLWAGLTAFAVLETVYGLIILPHGDRLIGTFPSANMYAAAIAPVVALGLTRSLKQPLYWLPTALLIIGLLLSKSLGGMLGLSAVVGITIWQHRSIARPFLVGILVVMAVVAGLVARDRVRVFARSSFESRIQIWHTATRLAINNPLTGTGLRGFETHYVQVVGTIYAQPIDWNVPEPHNFYLAFWLDLGLGGLLGLLALLMYFFQPTGLPFSAGQLALIALLVHGLVDTPFFQLELAWLFWLYVAWLVAEKLPKSPNPNDS